MNIYKTVEVKFSCFKIPVQSIFFSSCTWWEGCCCHKYLTLRIYFIVETVVKMFGFCYFACLFICFALWPHQHGHSLLVALCAGIALGSVQGNIRTTLDQTQVMYMHLSVYLLYYFSGFKCFLPLNYVLKGMWCFSLHPLDWYIFLYIKNYFSSKIMR